MPAGSLCLRNGSTIAVYNIILVSQDVIVGPESKSIDIDCYRGLCVFLLDPLLSLVRSCTSLSVQGAK